MKTTEFCKNFLRKVSRSKMFFFVLNHIAIIKISMLRNLDFSERCKEQNVFVKTKSPNGDVTLGDNYECSACIKFENNNR